jgi:hypothetical protein
VFAAAALLATGLAAGSAGAAALPSPPLEPFTAEFGADWKGIGIATSALELRRDAQPDRWIYTWRVSARGIFRMFYSDDLVQTSWFDLGSDGVRPRRYEATQGAKSVTLAFDWDTHRARGTEEGKPLELDLAAHTLDVLAIQIEVMQDLKSGSLPPRFSIIDRDEVKEFLYTREGSARLHTALGDLDTLIVASQREGNDRILRMWFAPSLGFIPVQAERTRGGKLEFAMRIRTLARH